MGMILTLADVVASSFTDLAAVAAQKARNAQLRMGADTKDGIIATNKLEAEAKSGQEKDKPRLGIHGGSNIRQLLATGRHFIFRKGLPIDISEFTLSSTKRAGLEPTWVDENIRVWAMPIERDGPVQLSEDDDHVDAPAPFPQERNFEDHPKVQTPLSVENSISNGYENSSQKENHRRSVVLRSIVSDMFDSDWRLDALVATPLSKVRMPATLFYRSKETDKIERYKGPMPDKDEPLPDIEVLVRKPWPGALIAELPATNPSATSMCYIVRLHPRRGKFDAKKAIALNVKPGPNFSELTAGKSVTSSDGQIVTPEQVLGPMKPGEGLAVVELPSREYVMNLIARQEWVSPEIMEGVETIVWNLGPGVVGDERLQDFINQHNTLKHVISSPDHSPNHLSMYDASVAAIRHNIIDPIHFGIPIYDNRAMALPPSLSQCIIARKGQNFQFTPSFLFKDPAILPLLNTANVLQETSPELKDMARSIQEEMQTEQVQKQTRDQDLPSPEAEIITLGTGSALPSKYRNVSATLLRVPGSGSYLFDCGENTLGQLSRIYGPDELAEVLRDLKMIWISHMHADHHLGTVSVIRAWYEATYGKEHEDRDLPTSSITQQSVDPCKYFTEQKRLFIASEPAMIKWLNEYASVEHYGHDRLVLLEVRSPNFALDENMTGMWWNGAPLGFSTVHPHV